MDTLDIQTEDITSDFFNFCATASGPPTFTLNSDTYKLTDTCVEHEVCEPRADIFCVSNLPSFQPILTAASSFTRTDEFYIGLYDALLISELRFLEGKPIFNSYYSCVMLHNVELLRADSLLFSIVGGYLQRLKSIFGVIYDSGVGNHEDFSYTHIPTNTLFEETRVLEIIAEQEIKLLDNNLKVKREVNRQETGYNGTDCT